MSTSQEAVAGLLEAIATPPDRNDLGRLARMHSCCQSLAEADLPPEIAPTHEAIRGLARALLALLERLILDEAADPDTGIALVPQAVNLINEVHQGQDGDTSALVAQLDAASGVAATSPEGSAQVDTASAPTEPAQPEAPPTQPEPVAAEAPAPSSPSPAGSTADEPYVSEPLHIDLEEREHLDGFLEESTEHMDAIEAGLLEVETNAGDTAKINELFRPFHTIKGIAGFLNLRDVNRLTHEIETILDLGRKNELKITTATVDLIFAGVDLLKAQLAAIGRYLAAPTDGPCPQPEISDIMQQLRRAARGEVVTCKRSDTPQATPDESPVSDQAECEPAIESASATQPAVAAGDREPAAPQAASGAKPGKAPAPQAGGKPVQEASIRVDTAKLDVLVDAVGELVIAQSMVSLSEGVSSDNKLQRNVNQVTKIVRDVQETAMAMRMIPVGHTFQKMRRLVRDVARKANKQVELAISGEETELDKNVIQQISDPLVHMVRNAVDHGLESPEQRRAAGKSENGNVHLDAHHQGDSIVIEIRDDGRGLDPQKLIAKGIERGLVTAGEQLTDQQAYALILQAGFSMAEKVTDISGRGVGMDVVRRNVEQLRGKIEISSEKGRGSVFSIRLPLTLAIIDGMIVGLRSERLIIPTILIEQSLRPERGQITSVQNRGQMLHVRGELCPLIQLGTLFDFIGPIDPCENLAVITQCEGQKVALVVEKLIGQQQVVIKTLGERFKQLQGVSGAAILGDGKVGLILEPSGLLALHNRQGSAMYSFDDAVVPSGRATIDEVIREPFDYESAPDGAAAVAAEPAVIAQGQESPAIGVPGASDQDSPLLA